MGKVSLSGAGSTSTANTYNDPYVDERRDNQARLLDKASRSLNPFYDYKDASSVARLQDVRKNIKSQAGLTTAMPAGKSRADYETFSQYAAPGENTANSQSWTESHGGDPNADPNKSASNAFNIEDTMKQWDEIFGEDNAKAFAGANEALDSQIAGAGRRTAELNAVSGRSAAGGGYQSGVAQAALSAGAAKGTLASNFYQNQQRQKQSFLERQLERALREGQFDKAQQLELALAQIGMMGDLGELEAGTDFLNLQEY